MEQTGEGTASARRRRAVRYGRQRPGYRQGVGSATPRAVRHEGFFLGRGGTSRRPAGRDGHLFRTSGEPVGDPSDGAAAFGRPHPTSTKHTSTITRRTPTEPVILRVCRASGGHSRRARLTHKSPLARGESSRPGITCLGLSAAKPVTADGFRSVPRAPRGPGP